MEPDHGECYTGAGLDYFTNQKRARMFELHSAYPTFGLWYTQWIVNPKRGLYCLLTVQLYGPKTKKIEDYSELSKETEDHMRSSVRRRHVISSASKELEKGPAPFVTE